MHAQEILSPIMKEVHHSLVGRVYRTASDPILLRPVQNVELDHLLFTACGEKE